MASIYGLYDASGNLRYIGKAINPTKRLNGHTRDANRKNTPVCAWIRKHGTPEMRILERDCVDWEASEREWIAKAREAGENLLNIADGGNQPYCSVEVRRQNGLDTIARGMRPKVEKVDSKERVVIDGYNWLRYFSRTRGMIDTLFRVEEKMKAAFKRDPKTFGCWAKV